MNSGPRPGRTFYEFPPGSPVNFEFFPKVERFKVNTSEGLIELDSSPFPENEALDDRPWDMEVHDYFPKELSSNGYLYRVQKDGKGDIKLIYMSRGPLVQGGNVMYHLPQDARVPLMELMGSLGNHTSRYVVFYVGSEEEMLDDETCNSNGCCGSSDY